MRRKGLTTKIFLDGGDPDETRAIQESLGFLDGQTTNPSFVSKNPEAQKKLDRGETFTEPELLEFYKGIVQEISGLIPDGSVSIEVYADENTSAEEMLEQGREMFGWIPNAHIKLPTSHEGIRAAEQAVKEGMRINMTLCFSLPQAAAVYSATRGAERGQVFISPFVGRLDDRGEDGMSFIANLLKLYGKGDGHVMVLSASLRHEGHLMESLQLGSDIITAKMETLDEWAKKGAPLPGQAYTYDPGDLKPLPYEDLDLEADWKSFDLAHPLTTQGMEKFTKDWNKLLGK